MKINSFSLKHLHKMLGTNLQNHLRIYRKNFFYCINLFFIVRKYRVRIRNKYSRSELNNNERIRKPKYKLRQSIRTRPVYSDPNIRIRLIYLSLKGQQALKNPRTDVGRRLEPAKSHAHLVLFQKWIKNKIKDYTINTIISVFSRQITIWKSHLRRILHEIKGPDQCWHITESDRNWRGSK